MARPISTLIAILRDIKSYHKSFDALHKAEKTGLELSGQYDGQPTINNERILSLDVDKVLYYIGCGTVGYA